MDERAFPKYGSLHDGMTLRDYFAAHAVQGICSNTNYWMRYCDSISKKGYEIADAMLEERKKHG